MAKVSMLQGWAPPTALIALFFSSSTLAAPTGPASIGYFLPKTLIKVSVSQRLVSCEPGSSPEVASSIEIEPIATPNDFVKVDTKSGFLAKRSTGLVLRTNGTLSSFNAKSEGQASKVIVAGLKLAAKIAAVAAVQSPDGNGKVGPAPMQAVTQGPTPSKLVCSKDALELLTVLASRKADIRTIEARLVAQSGNAIDQAMLDRRKAQVVALNDALTQASITLIDPTTSRDTSFGLEAVDVASWFTPNANLPAALHSAKIPGAYGFLAELAPDGPQLAAVSEGDKSFGPQDLTNATPYLIYRRPVDTDVTVSACDALGAEDAPCPLDNRDPAMEIVANDTVPIAQFSGLFSLRVGRGGVFGTRQAKATFDEFGVPSELEYGTIGGGEDFSGVVDAGSEAIGTLNDSKLKELERRLAIAKARKELTELETTE